ncbi:MAG: zinc ABC transporter substrate-binding protein [Acholeplasmatales bacterium]|nr:zinc ABC transporter substrate-binding protein [Acholeplasmatales bacterium]
MKRLMSLLLFTICSLMLVGCTNKEKYDVVSTNFIGYDISKYLCADAKCTMLLKPGEELHDYSPTVNDIEKVINSKIFIYIGGESDKEFVENDILKEINPNKTEVINLMEVVKTKYEEEDPESYIGDDGEEEEEEYDEHIWTSIENVKTIASKLRGALERATGKILFVPHERLICNELPNLQKEIQQIVDESSKKPLIFADRFPLLYFVKEFNLKYDAAFKGCESSKEANPKTIEKLTKKIIDNDVNTIFVIELSEAKIANTIVENCKKQGKNVSVRTFYTMHNISKEDYEKGMTYLDFMRLNVESLRIALN